MRLPRILLCGGIVLAAALSSAAPAGAQDYPPTTPPPTLPTTTTTTAPPCTITVTAEGNLVPGAPAVVIGTCIRLTDGTLVDGTLQSTPVQLPKVEVQGNVAKFPVTLPADFELKAFHTLTIKDATTGELLLNGKFYVDSAGKIVKAPSTALPTTGSNSTTPFAKAGVVLLAAGAGATVVARRRRRTTSPAA